MIHTNWSRPICHIGIPSRPEELSLRLDIASASTEQIYYRVDRDSIHVTDDLRQLVRPADALDERGIYSILQFGAVIPPLSPWKSISRAVPGRITTFRDQPVRIDETEFPHEQVLDQERHPLNLDQQISIVLDTLDQSLLSVRQTHRLIILFSGGVDSGLLASRAAALGLKDTLLINYSFGPDDAESLHAEQMAKQLGLSFLRIPELNSSGGVEDVLNSCGRDYRTPFCDHSVVPTSRLARSTINMFGPEFAVLDGTGADGAFGLFGRSRQWQKLHSIPRGLLRTGSLAYRVLKYWQKDSKTEYRLRLLRRASQHRFPLSAVAQNPLAGIAYHVTDQVYREVEALGISWLNSISPQDPRIQLAALDMNLVCSCMFAQKSKSLFAASALNITFPFLSPQMARIALLAGNWEGAGQEAKWLLKAALARQIPAEMVYRSKSGFVAPMGPTLRSGAFLAAFDKVLADKSPLSPFLEKKFLRDIRAKLSAKASPFPAQTTSALWAIVFVSEWLEQVTRAAATAHRAETTPLRVPPPATFAVHDCSAVSSPLVQSPP